jgi:peptide/nickel transport system permease protein
MSSYVKYILKRILYALLTIFIISIFIFLIVHLLPGDPVRSMMGVEADQEAVEAMREELHMNKPLPVQYFIWIKNAATGKFGKSLLLGTDIASMMKARLPVTLWLTLPALAISLILGIIIGVICATHRGSFADQILTVLMTLMNGIPGFWISIMLIYLFGVQLKLLPFIGFVNPLMDFKGYLLHAALPIFVMCFRPLSSYARHIRTNMLDVINQDYIRTAKAYGLSIVKIRYKYALKNVLIPVITLIALQVRTIIAGSLITEQIFSIAGVGRLITTSVQGNDFLVLQCLVLVISVFVVFANLLLDIAYGFLDPRIRLKGGK